MMRSCDKSMAISTRCASLTSTLSPTTDGPLACLQNVDGDAGARCGRMAPRQQRERKAEIGVSASKGACQHQGRWADRL